MKKIHSVAFTITIIFISTNLCFARDFRVNEIPNGNKFKCLNCHISDKGGKGLNPFGTVINPTYLDDNGHVIWNATLAALDSDGDGFTNGTELQDPMCGWKIGDPEPGLASSVSNPGNNNSTPPTSVLDQSIFNFNISPNPVRNTSRISYYLTNSANVKIAILCLNGLVVKTLLDAQEQNGDHMILWDGSDDNNRLLASGTYFICMSINGSSYRLLYKIILSK